MSFYKMTKEQLIAECRKLRSENDRLQDELDALSDCYSELENEAADLANTIDVTDTIKDMDWFKYKLELYGLLTPQLEQFIEYYLQYHNDIGRK